MLNKTCLLLVLSALSTAHAADQYFTIEVIDEQTVRGVPLVELKTVSNQRFYTDSNGLIAFNEPGLMDQKVFFHVASHGYEFPADGFGYRGIALDVKPGGHATLKIKRLNIAERLYRVTGQGIYRDTVLLGRKAPIEQPLLNAQVAGQDSVFALIYRGKIHWFWGDTSRPSYPLGQFQMSGAVSDLPEKGGLEPSAGVNLKYFVDENGFSKKMVPMEHTNPIWADGFMVLKDESGNERMLAHYSRMKDLGTRLERGLIVYNDEKEIFEKIAPVDVDAALAPAGHPFRVKLDDGEYFYFPCPYPAMRVKADWKHVTDLSAYEGYTPLKPGANYEKDNPPLDRDGKGRLNFSWKTSTPPLAPKELKELIESGKIKPEETPFRLQDVETEKPIILHGASVYWNDYRKRWIMIGLEGWGSSILGEVWFVEAKRPEGPWVNARKIVTHNKMDLYNPTQHPFFDEEGGRIVYFEGTYANTFSGDPTPTPLYEYNQVMYRLDLSDPRLELPDEQ